MLETRSRTKAHTACQNKFIDNNSFKLKIKYSIIHETFVIKESQELRTNIIILHNNEHSFSNLFIYSFRSCDKLVFLNQNK